MRQLLPACVLASVISSPAMAVTALVGLEEIIVTAARRPATSEQISAALSVIDREDVQAQKLTTDALASEVGVYLQQTTPGQGAAIIRGLKGSAILHLVDGMPLSNALFRSAPTPYLAYVPTTAVERIEVVRGTPASLYGSQAVGGVVQVVTHRPAFDTDQVQWTRSLSVAADSAELQKSLKGSIDFGTNRLAASLSGEYLRTGNRRTGGGDRIPQSGYESKAARFVVSATPTDGKTWLFDLHLLEQPKTPRVDELVPGFGQVEPSSSEFFFAPSQRFFAHLQHTTNDAWLGLDWRADVAWQRITDDRVTRDYEATTRRYEDNRSDLYALSINAAGTSDTMSWIVGTDVQTDEVRSARFEEDIPTASLGLIQARFPDRSNIDQAALFGNAEWTATARNHLSGGLRLSEVRIDVPETSVSDATTIDIRRLSGDVGWIFDLTDTWHLAANAGFGFRAPNISDLGTLGNRPGNRFNIPNTDLREETVTQFDAGIRQRSDRYQLEIMLYTLEFEDRITSVLTGDVTSDGRDIVQSVNATRSSVRGVEAGLEMNLSERVSAAAVLNYTFGEETSASGDKQAADRIPPLTGRLNVRFAVSTDWMIEGWFTAAAEQDRLSSRDIRDVRIDPNGTAGWTSLGINSSWRPNGIWQIDVGADNLLDKHYRSHGSGIDAAGRNFSIRIQANW